MITRISITRNAATEPIFKAVELLMLEQELRSRAMALAVLVKSSEPYGRYIRTGKIKASSPKGK